MRRWGQSRWKMQTTSAASCKPSVIWPLILLVIDGYNEVEPVMVHPGRRKMEKKPPRADGDRHAQALEKANRHYRFSKERKEYGIRQPYMRQKLK